MTLHRTGRRPRSGYQVVKPSGSAWRAGPLQMAGAFVVAIVVNLDAHDFGFTVMLAVAAVVIVGVFTAALLRSRLEIGPGVGVRRRVAGSTEITGDAVDRLLIRAPAVQAGSRWS